MKEFLTTAEAVEKYGISRQRFHQLRTGTINGGIYIAPRLIKDIDWHWKDGEILFDKKRLEIYFEGVKCED